MIPKWKEKHIKSVHKPKSKGMKYTINDKTNQTLNRNRNIDGNENKNVRIIVIKRLDETLTISFLWWKMKKNNFLCVSCTASICNVQFNFSFYSIFLRSFDNK